MRFDRFLFAALLAIVLSLAVGACGPLPRPMQPEEKSNDNPLLRLPDSVGVVVRPLADLPPEEAEALSQALITALHEANVPASPQSGNVESLILDGQVIAAGGRLRELAFVLHEHDGRTLGGHQVMVAFPAGPLAKPEDWADPAASVAAAVARLIQPRELAAPPPPAKAATAPAPAAAEAEPPVTGVRVRIKEVRGAPPERTQALARALEFNLRRERLVLADASTRPEDTVSVAGEVTLGPPGAAQRRVAIRWMVSDVAGRQLGTVDQANDVPTEVVERSWGEIAAAIGEGAAAGIINILERTTEGPARRDGPPPGRTFTGR